MNRVKFYESGPFVSLKQAVGWERDSRLHAAQGSLRKSSDSVVEYLLSVTCVISFDAQ